MQTKLYALFIACTVGAIGVTSGLAWKSIGSPSSAQAMSSSARSSETGQWININDYSAKPPFSIWINLERADSIHFYTGNYDTRQNVPQAIVTLGRSEIHVNDPHEIGVLRRYVQSHQLR